MFIKHNTLGKHLRSPELLASASYEVETCIIARQPVSGNGVPTGHIVRKINVYRVS